MRAANFLSYRNGESRREFITLLDLVFLLLFFFLVRPSLEPENRISADLPRENSTELLTTEIPLLEIEIVIQPANDHIGGDYWVGGEHFGDLADSVEGGAVIAQQIADALRRQSGGNPETPVVIFPAGDADFFSVIRALNGCYSAQMTSIRFGETGDNSQRRESFSVDD